MGSPTIVLRMSRESAPLTTPSQFTSPNKGLGVAVTGGITVAVGGAVQKLPASSLSGSSLGVDRRSGSTPHAGVTIGATVGIAVMVGTGSVAPGPSVERIIVHIFPS